MIDPLTGLNEQQQEAVTATHGPVLILAGAGSGKTRALTHRIAYLIHTGAAKPREILAVTFTNKAAGEMKERVQSLVGSPHQTPYSISTFHSLGARLLREAASFTTRSKSFVILDTRDSEKLVRQALQEANIPLREYTPKTIRQRISSAKNDMFTPEMIANAAQSKTDEIMALVWPRYEQLLAQHDAFDFDDLLVESTRLLENNLAIRQTLQQRWRFLNVDEYQDTNAIQEKMLQLLLGPEKNICVVGDDYQAIYSWRGARVDHILAFEKRYPNCRVIHLTQNYRSTPQILALAGEVIAGNKDQKHKNLWTTNPAGENVEIIALPSDRSEASFIRRHLVNHKEQGGSLNDCAILYRTNAQSRILEEELLTHQIPYTIVGGFRFYERREIKDALALLHWYVNPNSGLAVERLATALLPRVGAKTVQRWVEASAANQQTLYEYLIAHAATRPAIGRLLNAYKTIPAESSLHQLLRHLLHKTGYIAYLQELPDGEERLENIDELLNVTSVYSSAESFLEEVALLTDIETQQGGDKVTCMTLHAAKGLEFPVVFIAGCEEELLPHTSSLSDSSQIEEERRLLYVGITRARKRLIISHAQTRYQSGELRPRLASRFLEDVTTVTQDLGDYTDPIPDDEELVYVTKGEWITHPHFGRGVVIASGGNSITCVFEGHGVKTIQSEQVIPT